MDFAVPHGQPSVLLHSSKAVFISVKKMEKLWRNFGKRFNYEVCTIRTRGRRAHLSQSDRWALFQRCLIEIAWGRCRAGHGVTLAARGVN